MSQAQFEARMSEGKKDGFRKWLDEPNVKALISISPPSEHLEMLLMLTYEAGFGVGAVISTIGLVAELMNGKNLQ